MRPWTCAVVGWLACLGGCNFRSNSHGPVVAIACEATPSSPEATAESLAIPLEMSLLGAWHVQSVRSLSGEGRVVVWVEFEPGVAEREARQLVAERLAAVESLLPDEAAPELLPATGDAPILLIALHSAAPDQAVQLRSLAESSLAPRLTAVPHVADVSVTGGQVMQCQVIASPDKLAAHDVTVQELADAIEEALGSRFESSILADPQAIEKMVVSAEDARVSQVEDVAAVRFAVVAKDESAAATKAEREIPGAAVIVAVRAAPGAEIETLSRQIDGALVSFRGTLPTGARIERKIPKRLGRLMAATVEKVSRSLPPDIRLEARESDSLGHVLAAASQPPIAIRVIGGNPAELPQAFRQIEKVLQSAPGVANPRLVPPAEAPALRLTIDAERAARLGLKGADVAQAFDTAHRGRIVGRLLERGQRVEVVVRCDDANRSDVASLGMLRLRTSPGETIRLSQVAEMTHESAPSALYRENGMTVGMVLCDPIGSDRAKALAEVQKRLAAELRTLPEGCYVEAR